MNDDVLAIIQRSLDSIDLHIRTEIPACALAQEAGFSLSHFYHVFESVTGTSLGRYITRRRLLHAAYDMSRGRSATDAALIYGFNTHAGFYKAFRREYGCSPSQYLRTHKVASPTRINLKEETPMIDMKDVARALRAWNMEAEPVSGVYYANTGRRCEHTFAVGPSHLIRVSPRLGELHRLAALNRALSAHGLAPSLVPTAAGEDVLHMDNLDFMLTHRLSGAPLNAMHILEHPQEAQALGRGLARLHTALRSCDPCLCQFEDYAATISDWAIPSARTALREHANWINDFEARCRRLFPLLPTQIIHRDPNPDNLIMQDGEIVGFLDFDLSRIMPRIFDLCYAATGILSVVFAQASEAHLLRFFDAVHAIWQGYDAVSPLTEEEWEALPDMVLAIELTCIAAFAGSDKLAQQFATNVRMLDYLLTHIDRLQGAEA